MITNANEFISVDRINQRLTPYNTGKVQIGLLYQPKAPEMTSSEELVQAALMGWSSIHRPVPLWPVTICSLVIGFLIILTVG
tara:strand:+ start:292 stop:537 length:246 start_codon:yes stop_codon:yes gene_type:complete